MALGFAGFTALFDKVPRHCMPAKLRRLLSHSDLCSLLCINIIEPAMRLSCTRLLTEGRR